MASGLPFAVRPLVWALLLAFPVGANAASKATVAALGDAAPGGGIFAGPGFIGAPTAAGDGWIAFRGQLSGTASGETMTVAHVLPPVSRAEVASLGQPTPGPPPFDGCAGTVKQFIGRPAVNASGEVAFLALINPAASSKQNTSDDQGSPPPPAGLFVFRAGGLVPIACSGEVTPIGTLDLTAVVDPFSDADVGGIPDRSPAINDAGDVAFLSGIVDETGAATGGAIFLAPGAGGMGAVVRTHDPFDGGTFASLGPPALNNEGLIGFHGVVQRPDDLVDGIFLRQAGDIQLLVRDGMPVMPTGDVLQTFEDPVSINDRGDVAFLGGPFADNDTGSPGVLVYSAGMVRLIAYPLQKIGQYLVAGVALGAAGAGGLPVPSLGADGSVAFFVRLNDGNLEAMVLARWEGDAVDPTLEPVMFTGGNGADASPVGGVYAGAESGPTLDSDGGIVFRARIAAGASSEAVVYRSANGALEATTLGDAAPNQNGGFFGGAAFSAPLMNDAGDVAFRAFVARAPTSVGIFRLRGGKLAPVVRSGDLAPTPDGDDNLLDIVGQPSMNEAGAIAFAAQLANHPGRGIFVADGDGLHAVVLRNQAAPGDPGTVFSSLGMNPQINDVGQVAFRGTTVLRDSTTGATTVKQDGIFLADATGFHAMAYTTEMAPSGIPFLKLRDPRLSNTPTIVFRAPLGSSTEETSGIFLADRLTTFQVALEQQAIDTGLVLTGFSGTPAIGASGDIAFLATRGRRDGSDPTAITTLGPAIYRSTATGLGLVIARDMPGPAGGAFRGLGAPTINSSGHLFFRGSFQPKTGGTPGLFLARERVVVPYLRRGELSPVGGRFASFGAETSLNGNDEVAFTASVTGGKARSGIFVASPTILSPQGVRLHLSNGKGRDQIAMRLKLTPGRLSSGFQPGTDSLAISFADGGGTLWSTTVPAKQLRRRAGAWVATRARPGDLHRNLKALRLRVRRDGTVRVGMVSAPGDMTNGGVRKLAPPFTIAVEVGNDAGTAPVECIGSARRLQCH